MAENERLGIERSTTPCPFCRGVAHYHREVNDRKAGIVYIVYKCTICFGLELVDTVIPFPISLTKPQHELLTGKIYNLIRDFNLDSEQ